MSSRLDYCETLKAAWLDHLAERAKDAPTVVSTFAGCGGSSLGYSMAGFQELFATDWDEKAAASFKLNIPGPDLHVGDICKLTGKEILRRAGLAAGELGVLDGSPPCQGFSTAGVREFYDKRNDLFQQYVRLLRVLRPRMLVMENVSGMVKGKMRLRFVEILTALKAVGYNVRAWRLMATWYGVPQKRQRIIFIGIRNDLNGEPTSPPPTVKRAVTMGEAIGLQDEMIIAMGDQVGKICGVGAKPLLTVGSISYARVCARGAVMPKRELTGTSDSMAAKYNPALNLPAASLSSRTLETYRRLQPGETADVIGRSRRYEKVVTQRPGPTVYASYQMLMKEDEARALSVGEVMRLQSFPDEWEWPAGITWAEAWHQLGNSVPPLMMRAIANHIRATVLDR